MKRPLNLWLLVLVLSILSLSGLVGALGFLSDPSGVRMGMSAELTRLPVPDYTLPGLFLLLGMGVLPLLLLYGLIAQPEWATLQKLTPWSGTHWAWGGTLLLGLMLALWLAVQAVLIGFSAPVQWFTAGLAALLLLTTLAPSTRAFYSQR